MSNISVNPPVDFIDYRDPIWGDSYTWAWERNLNEVLKLVIHHSVTARDTSTPDDLAAIHKAKGWGGIGYHFVITGNGKVYYVGDIGTARANVGGNNEKVIGICLTGDFTKELPTQEQLKSCKALCEYFQTDFPPLVNINSWIDVIGHKEAAELWAGAEPTSCPGSNWKGPDDSLYNRLVSGHFDGYPTFYPPIDPSIDPQPTPPPATLEPCPDTATLNQVKDIFNRKGHWGRKYKEFAALLKR